MDASSTQIPHRNAATMALRYIFLTLRAIVVFPAGALFYLISGKTGSRTYQSFVWLFCITGGRINDWMSNLIRPWRPKLDIAEPVGMIGDMRGPVGRDLLQRLQRDGYVTIPNAVPLDMCDRLLEFAMTTPATIRRMAHESALRETHHTLFDPANLLAVRYDYSPPDLLAQRDVQALLADRSIVHLAQEYLGSQPVADVLSMWWHTGFQAQPDPEAAQFFHFDMDRFKWLKLFLYVTDVGPQNGPHSFVRGSHRTGAIPGDLLRRGYVRLTDEDVAAHFPVEDIVAVTAPRGSLIIEDTRGLHKGVHVSGAPRLVLQLQFSNSLFGTNYPPAKMSTVVDEGLRQALMLAPAIYRQYS